MRSFVVVCHPDLFSSYLETFCLEHSIPSSERYIFSDGVKIRDARTIKRILVSRARGKRLIALSCEITVPAQNALLKSIEEHDADTFIVISVPNKDMLLPTILSRCTLVYVHHTERTVHDSLFTLIENFVNTKSTESLFRLSTRLGSGEFADEDLMCAMSEYFSRASSYSLSSLSTLYYFANGYLRNIQIMSINHVNRKYFFDTALFEAKIGT